MLMCCYRCSQWFDTEYEQMLIGVPFKVSRLDMINHVTTTRMRMRNNHLPSHPPPTIFGGFVLPLYFQKELSDVVNKRKAYLAKPVTQVKNEGNKINGKRTKTAKRSLHFDTSSEFSDEEQIQLIDSNDDNDLSDEAGDAAMTMDKLNTIPTYEDEKEEDEDNDAGEDDRINAVITQQQAKIYDDFQGH
ncbi:hypothetical protein QE152_g14069 [Popillia japonica]|uniref:Uncharacterized protein n=1 Tax=Popillia japonica TaxID=7064 RepID=A0AAW1LB96_POPJA